MDAFQGIKLMILGKEKTGKTTLKKRLFKKLKVNVDQEESMTHGVEIKLWKDQKTNTLFSIYDFAGSEE